MSQKSDTDNELRFSIPKASASVLRGRQSVRASFKLSPRCVDAISILNSHLRLKPKSLFDHVVQEKAILEAAASKIEKSHPDEMSRTTKTYVISRDAADTLSDLAESRGIPRDDLVEVSIQHLMPLIHREQTRHRARISMLKRVRKRLESEKGLLKDMVTELGANDPMCNHMQNVVSSYEKMVSAMADFIEKGKSIENFDVEKK